MFVVAITCVWLWISWRSGWFPFSSGVAVTISEKTEQYLSEKRVLDSLMAPTTSSTTPSVSVLKSLTSSVPSKTNAKAVDTSSTLDSLTPLKK